MNAQEINMKPVCLSQDAADETQRQYNKSHGVIRQYQGIGHRGAAYVGFQKTFKERGIIKSIHNQ